MNTLYNDINNSYDIIIEYLFIYDVEQFWVFFK